MQLPQLCPTPRELDDLELLLVGAYGARDRFDDLITLDIPGGVDASQGLELVDPEGLPLAHMAADGSLSSVASPAYGAFRRLHLTPKQTREAYPEALIVPVVGPITQTDIAVIDETARGRSVVLLALCGTDTPQGMTPVGLIRATLAAADLLTNEAHVVAVPFASHGDAEIDHDLGQEVVAAFASGEVLGLAGVGELPDVVAAVLAQDQPEADERGLVVFFSGLSGSGKSTLARALHDLILEDGSHTVTSLDGDVVRRHLSEGLTFSKADRETNIRRIGWVAAEIARHRGIAICSPIAPFDATRQDVRRMVAQAGGQFVLVHVATSRAECERRDRKGLYAKARAGLIPEFTGISSPYEAPDDADVVVDTEGRTIEDALEDVLAVLRYHLRNKEPKPMADLLTMAALSVLLVSFGVGIVVGLTGMGGGALMTPALIFLGVPPTAAVANDLVAASVNKSVGAAVHWRRGSPNLKPAGLLVAGSVPLLSLVDSSSGRWATTSANRSSC
ncbi:MAG: adenylyl-sulfate kinase [Marmoricola sp.]